MTTRVSVDVTSVPANPAGAGRYVVEVVQRLARADGIELVVIARKNDGQRWAALAPGAEVHADAPAARPLRLLWEQTALPVLLSRYAPQVHLGPHYTLPEMARVARVVTIHDMTFFDHPEWHERSKVVVFRRAIASAARKADALIAVSHDTAQRVRERFGDVDITAVPLGVDHDRFSTKDDNDVELLAAHGITGEYVAFVGTIEPRKDTPSVVRAFDEIAAAHPELSLVLAGGAGWGVDALEAAIEEMRHPERVIRPGYLPDAAIPALLRRAKAVAYPSLVEGFGLPALEALACGAPLVTTRGSATEEVVDDAALLIDPGSVDQLTQSLETILIGGSAIDEMRKRGPEVASKYTWDATAAAHVDLLTRVVAKS